MARTPRQLRIRRHTRVRLKIAGTAARPRVAVSRSNKNISAQVIDDDAGRTLAAASSTEPALRGDVGTGIAAATKVGRLLAERVKAAGIDTVVFDRGGFTYHGRVAALADALRKEGVTF
ncbi:MAG TPA: 50S ribosomal protein L18 [Acidimicrobiales bacterium]|jgi:large subunit ribosomal protein L18|nr:50S ribosomal protein L18 [Acidimicrobiales bacterium]